MTNQARKNNAPSASIPEHWRSMAQTRCDELGERLTPARLGAYAELLEGKRALTAYELISLLEDRQGRKIAPLTVYRHLDFLMRVGLVHRIESTQSYLPCDHPEHDHECRYLLCSECGCVEELQSEHLESLLSQILDTRGFKPARSVVEISGTCAKCVKN